MSIRIKTQKQIEGIKKASDIIAGCFELAETSIKPGMSTRDIEKIMADFINAQGGKSASKGYYGFPGELCISVNEELIHGIPKSAKILKDGDIVSLDIMVWYNDCVSDAARTFAVGTVKPEVERLMNVTRESFFEGIKFARSGCHVNDIGSAIQKYVEANGFSVVRDYVGHGVGVEVHEEPEIPNYNVGSKGPRLAPGMVLAIEPMVSAGDYKVRVLKDDWTVVMLDKSMCSHYENTVLITDGDPQVLTLKEDK